MVKQTIENEKIKMISPYHPDLPKKARKIGGTWENGCWQFNKRSLESVNEIFDDVYGEHGQENVKRVNVKIKCDRYYAARDGIYLFGKLIARATGRDSGIREYGKDAEIKGDAYSSGSFKNWATEISGDVTIYDIPKLIFEKKKEWIGEQDNIEVIEVVEQQNKTDKTGLEKEKKELLKRLAEIEKLLKE